MALRSFTAPDGTVWNVWNVVPTLGRTDHRLAFAAGMAEGWLCFESSAGKRRLVPVPDGWDAWSDDQLRSSLQAAEPVPPRRPKEPSAPRPESDAARETSEG